MTDRIKSNLEAIKARIKNAADRSGRTEDQITLVGVTKYVGVDETTALFNAGCECLGENRPQLLWEKSDAMSALNVNWHMIGNLQRNKVKRTIEVASLIHSVDSHRLLTAIENAAATAGKTINVLLEVNISGDESKHGLRADQLPEAIEFASDLKHVSVRGLMCMAGLTGDADDARRDFAALRNLRDQQLANCPDNVELEELSMGMSGDFEAAIEEGATLVRIGSSLFR